MSFLRLAVLAMLLQLHSGLALTPPPQHGVEGVYEGTLDCPGAADRRECAALAGHVRVVLMETHGLSALYLSVHPASLSYRGHYRFHGCKLTRDGTAVEGSGSVVEIYAYLKPETGEMEATIRDAAFPSDLRIRARRVTETDPRALHYLFPGRYPWSSVDHVGEYRVFRPQYPGRFHFNATLGGRPPYIAHYRPENGEALSFQGHFNRDFGVLELVTPFAHGFPEKWFLRGSPGIGLHGFWISAKDGTWRSVSLHRITD